MPTASCAKSGRQRTTNPYRAWRSRPRIDRLAGWSEKLGRYWQCTEADLTDDGRELLAALRRLYAGHEVVLTTWLDT